MIAPTGVAAGCVFFCSFLLPGAGLKGIVIENHHAIAGLGQHEEALAIGIADDVVGHNHGGYGTHGVYIPVAEHEPLEFAEAFEMFVYVGLGELAEDLQYNGGCRVLSLLHEPLGQFFVAAAGYQLNPVSHQHCIFESL
jgi:hypothetical protein